MKKTIATITIIGALLTVAAKSVNYSSSAWDENSAHGEEFKVFLRDTDDNGNALAGTDRVFVNYKIRITGDDGTTRYSNVTRRLSAVPANVWTAQQKQDLWALIRAGHAAARAAATND